MSDKKNISPQQCRAARAILDWTRAELAARAKVGMMTLADFEGEKRVPYDRTLADVRRALEDGGVVFTDGNGHGPGVAPARPDDVPNGKGRMSISPRRPAKPSGEDAVAA
jgi:transcriptional regulator with XRE-family HTH domain